jgi:hypothetical protein
MCTFSFARISSRQGSAFLCNEGQYSRRNFASGKLALPRIVSFPSQVSKTQDMMGYEFWGHQQSVGKPRTSGWIAFVRHDGEGNF